MHRLSLIVVALLALGLWHWSQQRATAPAVDAAALSQIGAPAPSPSTGARPPVFLPAEAHAMLDRIARGGPFEYRQDGTVFHNRERRLPAQPRGYYREYTVSTPGSPDRGARRIVTGGQPPREYWYTEDHYRSFRRFEVAALGATP